mmetsp:Transcript_27960/g.57452  ORF Transcript_27960/g.57452 Transcript_27960/m.57452 type:complete len:365 (+) Transcript_27960:164-1258(+)
MTMHLVAAAYRRQPSLLPNFQLISNQWSKSVSTLTDKTFLSLKSFSTPQSMGPNANVSCSSHLYIPRIQKEGNGASFVKARLFSKSAELTDSPAVQLYQYHICPFCNITKSLMAYSKLDYDSVEVNPLTKAELKPWSGNYRRVPIAVVDGKQINGSEEIIKAVLNLPTVNTYLNTRWAEESKNTEDSSSKMDMQQFFESDNACRWVRFAADDLAALLYPNICGTLSDSYNAFGYVEDVDSFSGLQKVSIRYLGALAMHFAASKIKKKRNITDEKEALKLALDNFECEGLKNGAKLFSSGIDTPDMGDVAVFGVLYSVRGLNAHSDSIQVRGGVVKAWYDRMNLQILGKEAEHRIKLGLSCKNEK